MVRFMTVFQSTPPARGATYNTNHRILLFIISIHAPREGGDELNLDWLLNKVKISIHAPREGGDGFILNWTSMPF